MVGDIVDPIGVQARRRSFASRDRCRSVARDGVRNRMPDRANQRHSWRLVSANPCRVHVEHRPDLDRLESSCPRRWSTRCRRHRVERGGERRGNVCGRRRHRAERERKHDRRVSPQRVDRGVHNHRSHPWKRAQNPPQPRERQVFWPVSMNLVAMAEAEFTDRRRIDRRRHIARCSNRTLSHGSAVPCVTPALWRCTGCGQLNCKRHRVQLEDPSMCNHCKSTMVLFRVRRISRRKDQPQIFARG
jgi:predicted Zn-ribbon and HTH transcriptional regulator